MSSGSPSALPPWHGPPSIPGAARVPANERRASSRFRPKGSDPTARRRICRETQPSPPDSRHLEDALYQAHGASAGQRPGWDRGVPFRWRRRDTREKEEEKRRAGPHVAKTGGFLSSLWAPELRMITEGMHGDSSRPAVRSSSPSP